MLVEDRALILQAYPYGETSRILKLLCESHGLRTVIAKGARRPKSRFGGLLEPFTALFPDVRVGYVGLERDEETLQPTSYYLKVPSLEGASVLMVDGKISAVGGDLEALVEAVQIRPAPDVLRPVRVRGRVGAAGFRRGVRLGAHAGVPGVAGGPSGVRVRPEPLEAGVEDAPAVVRQEPARIGRGGVPEFAGSHFENEIVVHHAGHPVGREQVELQAEVEERRVRGVEERPQVVRAGVAVGRPVVEDEDVLGILRVGLHVVQPGDGKVEALIRGQVRGIDLQGQPVVANVVLQADTGAAVRWETFIQHSNTGPWKPIASVSLSDRFRDVDFNVGLNVEREANGELGIEQVYDGGGTLLEQRTDDIHQTGLKQMDLFLNAAGQRGKTLLAFNGKFSVKNGPEERLSTRIPLSTGVSEEVLFRDSQNTPSFELGLDAERDLISELTAKTIMLYTHNEYNLRNLQSDHDPAGARERAARKTRPAAARHERQLLRPPGRSLTARFPGQIDKRSRDGRQ